MNLNFKNIFMYVFFAILIVLSIYVNLNKGPWLDEGYSLFFGLNDRNLVEKFYGVWVLDVHPPLFSFLTYVVNIFYTLDIYNGRFLNYIPLFFLILYLSIYRDKKDFFTFSLIASILVLSSSPVYTSFVNFRSYFTANIFFLIYCLSLVNLYQVKSITKKDIIFLTISTFVCINIHYIYAFIALVLGVGFLFSIFNKKPKEALFFSIIIFSSIIPLLVFLYIQREFIESTHNSFWIKTNFLGALKTFIYAEISGFIIPCFILILFLIFNLLKGSKKYNFNSLGLVFFISIFLSILGLLIINNIQPIIIDRYITGVVILSIFSLMFFLGEDIYKVNLNFLTFFCILILLKSSFQISKSENWYSLIPEIKKSLKICESSKVYPFFDKENTIKRTDNELMNTQTAYYETFNFVASKNNINIQEINDISVKPYTNNCPNIIWFEHTKSLNDDEIKKNYLPNFSNCSLKIITKNSSIIVQVNDCS